MSKRNQIISAAASDARNTAIHEAGHAVAALSCEMTFKYVTIDADHESAGSVMLAELPVLVGFPPFHDLTSYGIFCLAGFAAERLFAKREGFPYRLTTSASDRASALKAAFTAAGDDGRGAKLYLDLWRWQAADLVERRASDIDAVAHALQDRRRLSQRDVFEVIRSRRQPKRRRLHDYPALEAGE